MCKKLAKNHIIIICENCSKERSVHKSEEGRAKYCSRECKYAASRGKPAWNKGLTLEQMNTFKKLLGNLEPIRLNTLLNLMKKELKDYVVNRTVQRLNGEEKVTNKPFKNIAIIGNNIPNYPLPINGRRYSPTPSENWGAV